MLLIVLERLAFDEDCQTEVVVSAADEPQEGRQAGEPAIL